MHQCPSCGGCCHRAGCQRLNTNDPAYKAMSEVTDQAAAEIARLQDLLKDALANVNEITDVKNAEIERLRTAAQAVVDRWGTPLWKDAPATAGYINRLRDALPAIGETMV